MARISSAIVWQGASRLTGDPIVAIVTGLGSRRSKNGKTGPMAQIFILRADMAPTDAVKFAKDDAICGGCKHRGFVTIAWGLVRMMGRSCYVTVIRINSVWKAFKRGSYPVLSPAEVAPLLAHLPTRLGAYGDPAAVPAHVWRDLLAEAPKHTGYTHQWREPGAEAYRPFLMASVDTVAEFAEARAAGWRTFRVHTQAEVLTAGEITCPASAEAHYRTSCYKCGLCSGSDDKAAKSIAILAHGSGAANFIPLQSLRS